MVAAAAAEKESLEQSSHGRSRSMLHSGLAPLLARVVSGDFTELRDLAVFLQEHTQRRWCLTGGP